MPVYVVERNFGEQADLPPENLEQINDVVNEVGAEWITSFLSADGKKTYCIYEANNPEQLREHSKIVGIPADQITEVDRFWPADPPADWSIADT